MEIEDLIWNKFQDEIIEEVLLTVGLSAINPMGKVATYFVKKFLGRFVRPRYDISVANAHGAWVKHFEENKLKELNEAINGKDRDKVIDIIDSLK